MLPLVIPVTGLEIGIIIVAAIIGLVILRTLASLAVIAIKIAIVLGVILIGASFLGFPIPLPFELPF